MQNIVQRGDWAPVGVLGSEVTPEFDAKNPSGAPDHNSRPSRPRRRSISGAITQELHKLIRPAVEATPSLCALPETRVTLYSGHIGNTSALCGSAKCLGRSVTRWMSGFDS
jgi:hypothetical protein